MARIIHIESATRICSVAISIDGQCVALKESHDTEYSHSEKLVEFMDQALKEARMKPSELDAVCVSKGPGSYTGLRIGVSAAKGLSYGLKIPLISVGSLHSMAYLVNRNHLQQLAEVDILCPMIDARRMEVYSQLFDAELRPENDISAVIVDEMSFRQELERGKMAFFGDGAEKCQGVLKHPNAVFINDFLPSATGMIDLADMKFAKGNFEDTAYFEPYYLKDFVAGKPKKMF